MSVSAAPPRDASYPWRCCEARKGYLCGVEQRGGQVMTRNLRVGDRVAWNSEAGRVTGVIFRKITSEIVFKGYRRHASKGEPQYLIKSDKTDHVAIHKATTLRRIRKTQAR
jgi:DUF2945 family protein